MLSHVPLVTEPAQGLSDHRGDPGQGAASFSGRRSARHAGPGPMSAWRNLQALDREAELLPMDGGANRACRGSTEAQTGCASAWMKWPAQSLPAEALRRDVRRMDRTSVCSMCQMRIIDMHTHRTAQTLDECKALHVLWSICSGNVGERLKPASGAVHGPMQRHRVPCQRQVL